MKVLRENEDEDKRENNSSREDKRCTEEHVGGCKMRVETKKRLRKRGRETE